MSRLLPIIFAISVMVWALVECVQSREDAVRNLPRAAWFGVILLVPLLGAAAWFMFGRPNDQPSPPAAGGPGARRPHAPRPHSPRGPDDDPDFLRKL